MHPDLSRLRRPTVIDTIPLKQLIRMRFIESVLVTTRYLNPTDITRVFEVKRPTVLSDIKRYKALNPGILWQRKNSKYMATFCFTPVKGLMPEGVSHEDYLTALTSVTGKQMIAGPR